MGRTSDAAIVDHIIVAQRLKYGFRAIERDANVLRLALWFSAGGVLLASLMLAHHLFDLPAVAFIWDLVVSICA